MRRGSIVGPLILILIGVLFLLNNLRIDVPVLEFLGRFWPFLLIGWGLIRLLEILIWAVRGKTLPASGISAGEWVLVFFLSILGTGLYVFHTRVGWPPAHIRMRGIEIFGEAFDYPIAEQKVAAPKTARIVIENFRGNTRIVGSDDAEVRVAGRKTIRSLSRDSADNVDSRTDLEVIEQGDAILVRTNQNRAAEERYVSADLEVTVPRGSSVQTRGRDGDVEISELQGSIDIDSERAGVRLQDIGGSVRIRVRRSDLVRAHSVQGGLELQGRGKDIDLENIQGQVTIDGFWGGELMFRSLAKPLRYQGSQAEIQVERVNGTVRLGRGFLNGESLAGPVVVRGRSKGCCDIVLRDFDSSLELSVQRGDLELRPASPVPKMNVELRNGNIDLALPEGAQFNLKARVDKGELQNDYGEPLRLLNENRGGEITGSVGNGAAISITSDRGSVTIRKAGEFSPVAPLTPEPPPNPRVQRSKIEAL